MKILIHKKWKRILTFAKREYIIKPYFTVSKPQGGDLMKKTLAEIREENKKSQKDMAEMLGIGISTYCQYETGKRSVPVEVVENITNILNINKNDIFLPTKFTVSK